ncbi:hypothetical protein PDESU_05339 [Pontiella desulfatans]|uniref:Uncharacterized protein n=1 Tax=Pontiella desulfatans TaxID=2750659 RepID=A0A6C2UAM9_PONDE|nr:hypothetical protein [Pontiella desulfatans]VGO16747.1 hypothetical protein PDESU_05339 [Pontiella desulfatans]
MDSRIFFHYLRRMGWGSLLMFLFCGLTFYDGKVDSVMSVVYPVIWICLPIAMEMKPGAGGSFRVHQALPVQPAFLRRFPFYIGLVAPMLMVLAATLPWGIYRTVVGDTAFWMNSFAPVMLGMSMYLMMMAVSMPLGHALKLHENPLKGTVVMSPLIAVLITAVFAIDKLWLLPLGRVLVCAMAFGFAGLSWWLAPLMADGKTIHLRFGKERGDRGEVKENSLFGKLACSPEGRCALAGMGLFALLAAFALFFWWKFRGEDFGRGGSIFAGMFFMLASIFGFMYSVLFAGSMRSLAALPLSRIQLSAKIMRCAMLVLLGGLLGMALVVFSSGEFAHLLIVAASALYAIAVVFLGLAAFYRVGFRLGYGVLLTFALIIQLRLMLSGIGDLLPAVGWVDLAVGAVGAALGTWAIPRALESSAAYAPKQMPGQRI